MVLIIDSTDDLRPRAYRDIVINATDSTGLLLQTGRANPGSITSNSNRARGSLIQLRVSYCRLGNRSLAGRLIPFTADGRQAALSSQLHHLAEVSCTFPPDSGPFDAWVTPDQASKLNRISQFSLATFIRALVHTWWFCDEPGALRSQLRHPYAIASS